jgi:predicted MFS family arabinose efflux permease
VYVLVNTNQYGWSSARTIGGLLGGAALLSAFVTIEARFATHPLVPLGIFRSRTLSGANAVALLLGLAIFAVFYFLSLYMQQVLGFSPLRTGFAYLPITMGFIVVGGAAPALVGRLGVKWLLAVGMLVAAGAFLLLAQLPDHGAYAANILPAFIVLPLGAGLAFLSVTNAAVAGVEQRDAGLASALLNTSQQVGGAVGLGLLSTIAASRTTSVLGTDPQAGLAHALVSGFHVAFLVAGAIAAAGAVLALLTIPSGIGRSERETAGEPVPEGVAARIAATVDSWEGATAYSHASGDIELRAGEQELGYLHGDTLADLQLPSGVRDRAIASGLAHPHNILPNSDWVSMHIHTPEQIHEVIDLLRSAYERAMRLPIGEPST